MSAIHAALEVLLAGDELQPEVMQPAIRQVMAGEATPAQLGALLVALRMKGETPVEIAAAAATMREFAEMVQVDTALPLIDTCGTGGDGTRTFNVSTATALVAAAAGAHVAKHGNRAVSGHCGSADLLQQAGVCLELTPAAVGTCIERIGIGFLFAPRHHAALRHAAAVRRELRLRTLFNLLGPLLNPAGARRHLLGVYDAAWVLPVATALQRLGSTHAMVVHAEDGLDEISIHAATRVAELRHGEVREYRLQPGELGIDTGGSLADLTVTDAAASLALVQAVFADEPGPAREVVVLNAAAALYVAGRAADLAAGLRQAREAIASGAAAAKLQALVRLSHELHAA